jgi:hypothetical protein
MGNAMVIIEVMGPPTFQQDLAKARVTKEVEVVLCIVWKVTSILEHAVPVACRTHLLLTVSIHMSQ